MSYDKASSSSSTSFISMEWNSLQFRVTCQVELLASKSCWILMFEFLSSNKIGSINNNDLADETNNNIKLEIL